MGRKIIDIYHRVSRIERKKKKCDSRFGFIASSSSDSIVSPLWNVARLKIIETHTRGNSVRKGRKRMVGSPYPFVCEEITFASRAFVSSNREGIYKIRTTSFDIFSMLVKFDSTCFRFFFFFKGENRLHLPFSFDDSAIKLNIDRATKGI